MSSEINFQFIRPFGPIICKVTMPKEIIENLNNYVDEIIKNEKKIKELDHGKNLAGNVKQEFKLEKKFIEDSKWGVFLSNCSKAWIKQTLNQEISKFQLISSWIVRQFKNEYNPIHFHSGNISGVGYLKIPKNITKSRKRLKTNGTIDFIHGSKSFLNNSLFNHNPKVGDMILFPNYLMHTAYPFKREGERRSFSFNIDIDKKTFDVFNG